MKQIVLLNEQKAYILETHLTTRRCQMKQKYTTNSMLQNVKIRKSNFSSNYVYKVWIKNQPLMSQTHSRPLETQAVYHSSGGFCAKSCKPLVARQSVLSREEWRQESSERHLRHWNLTPPGAKVRRPTPDASYIMLTAG